MFCEKCGFEMEEGSAFCQNCGAAVGAQEPVVETEAVPVEETVMEEPIVETTEDPGKTMGLISMIASLAAIVLGGCGCVCTFSVPVAAIAAIVGVVLGFMGMKKSKEVGLKNTFALVGIIAGIFALVVSVIAGVVMIAMSGVSILGAAMSEM